jgi:hypothetical protein
MKGDFPRFGAAYADKAWVVPCVLVIATPALVSAAGADAHPRFGPILFSLAVLVVSAKVGGLLAERWHQPPVLGELLAGIALANLLPLFVDAGRLAFIHADRTFRVLAEVGVLILLFDVGLEEDLRALAWTPGRDISGNLVVRIRFDRATCRACPARQACTWAKDAPCQLAARPKAQHKAIQAARQRQETAEFTAQYARRAGGEGTHVQPIRRCGLRQSRYMGWPGYIGSICSRPLPSMWSG